MSMWDPDQADAWRKADAERAAAEKANPDIAAVRVGNLILKAERYIIHAPGSIFATHKGRGAHPVAVLANVIPPDDHVMIHFAWTADGTRLPENDSAAESIKVEVLAEERRRRDARRTGKRIPPVEHDNTRVWVNRDIAADGDGGRGPSTGASCGETDGGH